MERSGIDGGEDVEEATDGGDDAVGGGDRGVFRSGGERRAAAVRGQVSLP